MLTLTSSGGPRISGGSFSFAKRCVLPFQGTQSDSFEKRPVLFGNKAELTDYDRNSGSFRDRDMYDVIAPWMQRQVQKLDNPLNLLVLGYGFGEEPLSYLSILYSQLRPGQELSDVVDLHVVDAQRLDGRMGYRLGDGSPPGYALKAFVRAESSGGYYYSRGEYRAIKPGDWIVKPQIRGYLLDLIDSAEANQGKLLSKTYIEDLVRNPHWLNRPREGFDIVSANLILYFVDWHEKEAVFKYLTSLVKPGGLFICSEVFSTEDELLGRDFSKQFEALGTNVFRKKE